jgi:hypothetical protein
VRQLNLCANDDQAIKDRLTSLSFEDCKVRVTNVDSQGSDTNIVIQVIGEMSNKSQPHRKFVQTFVLAGQTNGYFVLNDIFRYIKEDEEETEGEVTQQEPEAAVGGVEAPVPTAIDSAYGTESKEAVQNEEEAVVVDKKLEVVQQEEEVQQQPAAPVNGTPAPESVDVVEAEDAPAAAVSALETKAEEIETDVAQEDLEPEKPKDPVPTPSAEPAQPAAAPAAPPKPAVPRSWAQLAAGNRATQAAAAAAAAAPRSATTASQPKQSAPAPPSSQPTSAVPSAPNATAREPSPDSNKDGSTGGWQTAGAGHDRKQSRTHNAPVVGQDGRVRAFVKNVTDDVDAEALKSLLSKFGEVIYFDVARQKVHPALLIAHTPL